VDGTGLGLCEVEGFGISRKLVLLFVKIRSATDCGLEHIERSAYVAHFEDLYWY
jgi:hypothetical protein